MIDRQTFYRALGEKIRGLRQGQNLTLEALIRAANLDIARATLANIELGKQQVSAYQLASLAKGLNVNILDFFTFSLEQNSPSPTEDMKDLIDSL